jgi:hypothetical protein
VAAGLFVGVAMPVMMEAPELQQGDAPPPEFMFDILSWTYVGLGAVAGIIGALNVFAGYRNWKFKGRVLGIVALAAEAWR